MEMAGAWRAGRGLNFDGKTESFDDAEANKWLGREGRKGFEPSKVQSAPALPVSPGLGLVSCLFPGGRLRLVLRENVRGNKFGTEADGD